MHIDETSECPEPKPVQIIVANNVGFDQRVIDQIVDGIREAVAERDVIIFKSDGDLT